MAIDMSCLESDSPLFGVNDELSSGLLTAPSFELPSIIDLDGSQKEAKQTLKPAKGTTTIAFIFKEGVMVAADSRASMGGYISSQSVKKIIEINPYILGTIAGGAADCQFWHRNLGIKGPGLYYVDSEGEDSKELLVHRMLMVYWIMEGAELARRAIYHATFQDGASDGVASIYYVGPNGWKTTFGDDVGELHYKYYPVVQGTVEQEMIELSGA